MKCIRALDMSIYTVGGAIALALVSACSSGTAEPTGGGGSGGGNTTPTSTTGGDSTSGTTSATSSSSTGGSSTPSICDNNTHVVTVDNGFVDDFETDKVFKGWYSFADTEPANYKVIAAQAGGAATTTMSG